MIPPLENWVTFHITEMTRELPVIEISCVCSEKRHDLHNTGFHKWFSRQYKESDHMTFYFTVNINHLEHVSRLMLGCDEWDLLGQF